MFEFGTEVEAAMENVKHKNPKMEARKREEVLKRYLGLTKGPSTETKFADPATKAKRGGDA